MVRNQETHELQKLVMLPFVVDIDADPRTASLDSMFDMRSDKGFFPELRRYECTCGEQFDTESEARAHADE